MYVQPRGGENWVLPGVGVFGDVQHVLLVDLEKHGDILSTSVRVKH